MCTAVYIALYIITLNKLHYIHHIVIKIHFNLNSEFTNKNITYQ